MKRKQHSESANPYGKMRPAIVARIKNGELHFGKATMYHADQVIGDADAAIAALLAGRTIYLKQYGPLVTEVQRSIKKAIGTEE